MNLCIHDLICDDTSLFTIIHSELYIYLPNVLIAKQQPPSAAYWPEMLYNPHTKPEVSINTMG